MADKQKGRPLLPPELKKKTISFVLNDVQFKEYMRQAEAKGLDRNEYLIHKLHLNKKQK